MCNKRQGKGDEGDHLTPNIVHMPLVYFILSCVRTRVNENSLK